MKSFVHLHVHTEYSLLDGLTRIDKLFSYCNEMNMPAIAITDHGNMYGAYQFYSELAKHQLKEGETPVKPIIGCEFYVCEDLTVKKGKVNGEFNHLVLLAKNNTGYFNLMRLNSIAFVDGFYYKPRIDFKTLKKYSEGLICLSACLAGEIPQLLLQNRKEDAKLAAQRYKDLFGEDYYIELQDHGIPEQKHTNPQLIEIARELNISLVATNDVHYLSKEDSEAQDILMCVQMQKFVDDPNRMKFQSDEFYLKSGDEMAQLFDYVPDAVENTLKIAEKCNVTIEKKQLLPQYKPDTGQTPEEFFYDLLQSGLKSRYETVTDEIRDRAEMEFNVISKMGFVEYYLIVWDFINYAKSKGIPVGPGRGSGAGSIIAYAIGITDIEPLKYGLIFERFLNPERVSMPDFDIDFSDDRRGEVIDYVIQKYGHENVAQIVTFGTLAAKAAIKDVGRVLRVPYGDVDKITKLIPPGKVSLKRLFGMEPPKDGEAPIEELRQAYKNDVQIQKVVDMAIKLEGMPRNTSTHAAGVVICREPISHNVPLQRNGDDITTQYTMTEVEQLGLLKMDFLGLRTLSDISKAIDFVKQTTGKTISFEKCAYDDPKVFELISSGDTDAVFQLESEGMKRLMKNLQPTNLEDIIAGISLYRPGPMAFIPNYIAGKRNADKVTYDHPLLEPVLKATYGCMVYQEQVMKIVQDLGGFSLGRADIIRRAMSKKKADEMERQRALFINGEVDADGNVIVDGAVRRGVSEEIAVKIFNEVTAFSEYAFNKSHAGAYAVVAYMTAYLKAHYPTEFLAAVLNNRITKIEDVASYIQYCFEKNIEVLPPDINESLAGFSVVKGKIRFGLSAIKNIGSAAIQLIVDEREQNGKFKNLTDLLSRVKAGTLNKRAVENLIYAGAFDCFGFKRVQMIMTFEQMMEAAQKEQRQKECGQFSFFDMMEGVAAPEVKMPEAEEYSPRHKLEKEKEVLGMYVSGHPLDEHVSRMKGYSFNTSMVRSFDSSGDETDEENDYGDSEIQKLNNTKVTAGGLLSNIRKFTTKTNQQMAAAVLEDMYGTIEVLVPPKSFKELKDLLIEDSLVSITGTLLVRRDEQAKIMVDNLEIWTENEVQVRSQSTLYINLPQKDETVFEAALDVLNSYQGDINVVVKMEGKPYRVPQKVRDCRAVIIELEALLGNGNVIMITK